MEGFDGGLEVVRGDLLAGEFGRSQGYLGLLWGHGGGCGRSDSLTKDVEDFTIIESGVLSEGRSYLTNIYKAAQHKIKSKQET